MRIVSLVPAATDILVALGFGPELVGVSHECELPDGSTEVARLTRSTVDTVPLSSGDIHAAVVDQVDSGGPMYVLDHQRLAALEPDLIVSQQLCEVCALPADAVESILPDVAPNAELVSLDGTSVDGVLDSIELLGAHAGRGAEARALADSLRARLAWVGSAVAGRDPMPVVCLEWLDPPFSAGHWIPEMVSRAGGRELLGRAGTRSRVVEWDDVERVRPPTVIALPCGFNLDRAVAELEVVSRRPAWRRAVGEAAVHVAAGGAYFTRPGPGLVTGVEVLASVLHPDAAPWSVPPDAVARWR